MVKSIKESKIVGFRLTPEARDLLEALDKSEGLTMTGYLETTLRKLAREKGITAEPEEQNP